MYHYTYVCMLHACRYILCRQTCMIVYVYSMYVCLSEARQAEVYACMFPCKYV